MIAEVDMAQDNAELDDSALCKKVQAFLSKDFGAYDTDLKSYQESTPAPKAAPMPLSKAEVAQAEVMGWAAMFYSHNYELAADRFEEVWEAYLAANVMEMGAFQKWIWAKAVFLQSTQDQPTTRARAFELAAEAIKRGGQASWFNRLRVSLNRAKAEKSAAASLIQHDYGATLVRSFDDHLEVLGTKERFEKYCKNLTEGLGSEKHQKYCEALEILGKLLGYQATRPKGQAVTDNRWRGTFGQTKEVMTFEAKIEHQDGNTITATHMGQAHNQYNRAVAEFNHLGYGVRGTIVTHLKGIDPTAQSSAGIIRIIDKGTISALWERVHTLLSNYRGGWSVDDIASRGPAMEALYAKCPPTGWLFRVIDQDNLFISADLLLKEWPN
jgi:hypothetical protein